MKAKVLLAVVSALLIVDLAARIIPSKVAAAAGEPDYNIFESPAMDEADSQEEERLVRNFEATIVSATKRGWRMKSFSAVSRGNAGTRLWVMMER